MTGSDFLATTDGVRNLLSSMNLPDPGTSRVVIELDHGTQIESFLANIDELERKMKSAPSGFCTIWVERTTAIDQPMPLLLAVKIGASCVQVPIGVEVRLQTLTEESSMKARATSKERARFLRRVVHHFFPKIRSLVKKVVHSRFFIDAHANNDRIIRRALLAHPIAIFPALARPALFRIFALEGVFSEGRFEIGTRCQTFSVTVDMGAETIWSAMPMGLVRFVTPRLVLPAPFDISAILQDAPVRLSDTRCYSLIRDPSFDPNVTAADIALDKIARTSSHSDRMEQLETILSLLPIIRTSIWLDRGLIPVLLKCLSVRSTHSDPITRVVVTIFRNLSKGSLEFTEMSIGSILASIRSHPYHTQLLMVLLALVSGSPSACRSAVKQHAIQILFQFLRHVSWCVDSGNSTGQEGRRLLQNRPKALIHFITPRDEAFRESTLAAPVKSILNQLARASVAFRSGQDAVLIELPALLHHIRDLRLASRPPFTRAITPFRPPQQAKGVLSLAADTNPHDNAAPILAIRILIHLVAGLPESYALPINHGSLLNIAELLPPLTLPSAEVWLVKLISTCEERWGKYLSFIDFVMRRLIPLSVETSRATDSMLNVTASFLEADPTRCTRSEILFLTTTELFKHVSQLAAVELFASDDTITTVSSLVRIWTIICKSCDSPSLNNLIYINLIRDVTVFERLSNIMGRLIQPEITAAGLMFLNACLKLFLQVSKLSQRLKAMPKRTHKLWLNSRSIFGFPDGILYRLMFLLCDDDSPVREAPYRLDLLEKLFDVVGRSSLRMELFSPQCAEQHQDRISWHYRRFIRRYCRLDISPLDLRICRFHMQMLLSLAETRTELALDRFDQLKVALFLAHEFSLEYESRLPHKIVMRHIHRRRSTMPPDSEAALMMGQNNSFERDHMSKDDSSGSVGGSTQDPVREISTSKLGASAAFSVADSEPNALLEARETAASMSSIYEAPDIPGAIDPVSQSAVSQRPITFVPRLHLKRNSIQTSKSTNTEYIEQRILREADENRRLRHLSSRSSMRGVKDSKIRESAFTSKRSSYDSQGPSDADDDDFTDSGEDNLTNNGDSSTYDSDEPAETVLVKAMKKISGPIATLRRASIETGHGALQLLARHFSTDSGVRSSMAFSAPKSKTKSGKSTVSGKSAHSIKSGGGSVKSGGGNSAGTIKSRASSARVRVGSVASSVGPTQIQHRYFEKRQQRALYHDIDLHLSMIRLLLRLMLARNHMTLNESLCHRMPITNLPHQLNIPFVLHQHCNYPANARTFERLEAMEIRAGQAPYRLLRLLLIRAFHSTGVVHKHRKAKGRFGALFESNYPHHPDPVAVKVVDVPFAHHDYCVVHDLFSEIAVMERFRNCAHISHLYDFGVNEDGYHLIMTLFPMSLRQWRLSNANTLTSSSLGPMLDQNSTDKQQQANWRLLETCLDLYSDVLYAVSDLHANNCIHFDLKCDNVLLRSKTNANAVPTSKHQVALTDFGESLMWNPALGEEGNSLIGRGTENIQSPEILSLTAPDNDSKRRWSNGTSSRSRERQLVSTKADVWAIGCLLYELLTGEFLFEEKHGMPIFFQVISKSQPVVAHKQKAMLSSLFGEAISNAITGFISAVLIRNVKRRPDIQSVVSMFHQLRSVIQQIQNERMVNQTQSPWQKKMHMARMISSRAITKLRNPRSRYQVEPSTTSRAMNRANTLNPKPVIPIVSRPTPSSSSTTPKLDDPMKDLVVYSALRDGFPELHHLPTTLTTAIRRVTTMCWIGTTVDLPAKILPDLYRAGFYQIVHCGVADITTDVNLSTRNVLIVGGQFAGRCHSLPSDSGNHQHRRLISDLANWVEQFAEPCAVIIIESILKGNAVIVCGHDPVTPVVLVLVCLIRAYRVSLMEAILVLRQNNLVSAIDARLLAAIQEWISRTGPNPAPVKPSQNQYGCFCAESVIKLSVSGLNEQVRPCACEVSDNVDCVLSSCWSALQRYRNLYGRDFSRIHWRKSMVGDLITGRCRTSQLIVYEAIKAGVYRNEWTSFACRKCHYVIVAIRGTWQTIDFNAMSADLELVIATNLSQLLDNRPNGFHAVTEFHTATSDADDRHLAAY